MSQEQGSCHRCQRRSCVKPASRADPSETLEHAVVPLTLMMPSLCSFSVCARLVVSGGVTSRARPCNTCVWAVRICRDALLSGTAKGFLIACRMEDEGARSACAVMAEARAGYVGPGTRRLSSHLSCVPTTASHQSAQADGTVLGTRVASVESAMNTGDASRTSPFPHTAAKTYRDYPRRTSSGLNYASPLRFSATLEPPAAAVDEDTTFRCPEITTSDRISEVPGGTHSALPSLRRSLGTDTVRFRDT